MLIHQPWTAVAGLRHGFLDRRECAKDGWDAVLARAGAPLPIVVPRQVHGTRVVGGVRGECPEADAIVTSDAGLLVGVVTADCGAVVARRSGSHERGYPRPVHFM